MTKKKILKGMGNQEASTASIWCSDYYTEIDIDKWNKRYPTMGLKNYKIFKIKK